MPPDPLQSPWLILENTLTPGEHITIQSGPEKYALVFTDPALAALFLVDLGDDALRVSSLENEVLKESFLSAVTLIGATRVLFDYQRGAGGANSASLPQLHEVVRGKVKGESRK